MSKEPKLIGTFEAEEDVKVPGEGEVKKMFTFAVYEPSLEDFREGRKAYNTAFSDAIKAGAVVRERIEDVAREQKLWDDDKAADLERLQRESLAKEKKLAEGGMKLSEAKALALEIRDLRGKTLELLTPKSQLDVNSAQGQADNEQFNCLVSCCLVYNDNKQRRFKSLEEYLNSANSEVASKAANMLAKHMYGVNEDFQKNLPENRFLKEFGFINDKLQFVDKENHPTDEKGRRINEKGHYIDKDGNRVDENGAPLDEETGDYIVKAKPYLDDDGNEIDKVWTSYGDKSKSKVEVEVEPAKVETTTAE